jgi:glycosyltransferase involved in cell wall biosynthesis
VVVLTQKTDEKQKEKEIIDSLPIIRFDCGDLQERINDFKILPSEEKEMVAQTTFNKDDIENTALKLADELMDYIKKEKPRAIHVHNSFFIFPYALYYLKQKYDTQFLPSIYFWCHSPPMKIVLPSSEEANLYSGLASFQQLFDQIFSVSESVHNYLLKDGINSKVKYLGIDTEFFQRSQKKRLVKRKELGFLETNQIITYSGRIIKSKGLDLLPEICEQLLSRSEIFQSVYFLIIGEGEYKEEFQQLVNQKNLMDRFTFTSTTDDEEIVAFFSASDCFIFPTRREALGISLLEAMSCSLPCIASELPGTKELVQHPKNGILVPQDNLSEFTRWLSTIFLKKDLKEQLGLAARKTVLEQFSFEKHIKYFLRKLCS